MTRRRFIFSGRYIYICGISLDYLTCIAKINIFFADMFILEKAKEGQYI